MGLDFESETTATRDDAATVIRDLADGVTDGALRFGADEDAVSIAVPAELDLEVEAETEDGATSVEIELEWACPEGGEVASAFEPTADDARESETASTTERDEASSAALGEPGAALEDSGPDREEADGADADVGGGGDGTRTTGSAAATAAVAGTAEGSDDADRPDDAAASPVGPAGPREGRARFEVFRDRADEWRWRLVHRNGNVIATSGEGYTRKHNAAKGLRSVVRNAPEATVVEE